MTKDSEAAGVRRRKTPPVEQRDYYTLEETARVIGCGASTLRNWIKAREGPKYYMIGREYRFLKSEVRRWLEEQQRGGTAA